MTTDLEEISVFKPELDIGPEEFIILTEQHTLDDYNWIIDNFNPDLTYILYPSTFFTSYFRPYNKILNAHSPDNIGINSAIYALTENKHKYGFYNTFCRRCYAYFCETQSILNGCDLNDLYFNLSTKISDNNYKQSVIMKPKSINKDGLYIRGIQDYMFNTLFISNETELYESHMEEYAKNIENESIPKHQYFLNLWNDHINTENENEFWKYLTKWRDMIYWDYVADSSAYMPHPLFTKILRKSYSIYPPTDPLKHLPINTSFKSLVHDAYTSLSEMDNIEKVVLVLPTSAYNDPFCEFYGNTTHKDLMYASKYNEFDEFMHPRIRPFVYSGIGFGIGYLFKKQQLKYNDFPWTRRAFRCCRYTANGLTTGFLGLYFFSAWYFNLISTHSYANSVNAKQFDKLKNPDKFEQNLKQKKKSWTEIIFRKFQR